MAPGNVGGGFWVRCATCFHGHEPSNPLVLFNCKHLSCQRCAHRAKEYFTNDGTTAACPVCKATPVRAIVLGSKDVPPMIGDLFGNTVRASKHMCEPIVFQDFQLNTLTEEFVKEIKMVENQYHAEMNKLYQEYRGANDRLGRGTLDANKLEKELAQLRSLMISKENQRRHQPSRPEDVRSPGRGARPNPFEIRSPTRSGRNARPILFEVRSPGRDARPKQFEIRSPTRSGRDARPNPFEMRSPESTKSRGSHGSRRSRGSDHQGDRSLSPHGSRRRNPFQEHTDQRGVGYAIKRFFM